MTTQCLSLGNSKKIQAEDSDDSDDAVPFSNRSNKKESPKKILESSRKIQEEKLIKKSPLPEKTSKKSLRDLHQNSHDSDSDVPIFNKNTRNMEKESNLVKLHRTRNSDDDVPFSKHKADRKIEKASKSKKIAKKANSSDDSDEVPCNSKPVIQSTKKIKRQRSESEICVTQPSKRLKKSQRSESDHDNFEKTKRINGKAKSNEDHNELSGSNSNVDLKPRIIHEQLLHNKKTEVNPQKHSKKRNSKPAHDMSSDSDSEIEKANIQIKKEKDLQTKDDNCSHTARLLPDNSDNESNGIKNNSNKNWSDLMDETVDSDDDFASFMLAQKIEKEPDSEMKRKGDEDVEEDSIQMLLHAQHIKSEAEKSTRPKVEHQEVNDSNIFKINKEKKKKKSKKQEGEPKVKIKKEKEKTVSASNEQSSSMLPPKASKRKQLRSSALTSPEDSGEVSDACSTKSRILVKREESVFFTNITIKQEPYSSDVESISSRKRVRTESAKLSIERNDTFENIRIKPEPSDGKSEPHEKTNKIKKEKFMNDPSIKSEEDYSDGAPPKKKSKKKFSE
uniref:Uncharacterized protein n=1 Tax=Fopius arisanus TaxID=64838 RepID=A0A0C9REK3_9HYME